jgi:hypothetical protein
MHGPVPVLQRLSAHGVTVGTAVGALVGPAEGVTVGPAVGVVVGAALGDADGAPVGVALGDAVGAAEGPAVGEAVGENVVAVVVTVVVAVVVSVVVGVVLPHSEKDGGQTPPAPSNAAHVTLVPILRWQGPALEVQPSHFGYTLQSRKLLGHVRGGAEALYGKHTPY